jgi:orotate phosphoribosyltransferase
MTLRREDILEIFKDSGALLEGHFILTSGLHSDKYFQCAKVFQYPWHAEALCRDIADHFRDEKIDVVVSPAVGGIVFGQEVGRLLGVRAIFAERVDGQMTLRRGFEIRPGERVLLAEDVTTTGGSVKEVLEAVKGMGAEIVAVTAVVDRSGGNARFEVPYFSLFQMVVTNYEPADCPLCALGSVAVKPGSRGLK